MNMNAYEHMHIVSENQDFLKYLWIKSIIIPTWKHLDGWKPFSWSFDQSECTSPQVGWTSQYLSQKTSARVLLIWRCSIEVEAREWIHVVAWNIRNTFMTFKYSPKRFKIKNKLASNETFLALSNSANFVTSGYSYKSLRFQVKRTHFVLPFNIF